MKNSDAHEFSTPSAATLSFRSLDANDLVTLLPAFYLRLGFDARRARFGCAVSDDSISRHCRSLSSNDAIVLGCWDPDGLVAAVELHPLSMTWEDAELALAEAATTDRTTIVGHLLQLAAFAAGKRGCHTLVVPLELPDHYLLRMLRGMGRVQVSAESARVDLGDYARLYGFTGR